MSDTDDDTAPDVSDLPPDDGAKPVGFDADAAAELFGLSELQKKWALAHLQGANFRKSAELAGYRGTAEQLRSAGSKVARSEKVRQFLNVARLQGAGPADGPVDGAETYRILSRFARGSDKSAAIRAIELLHRIDEHGREVERAAGDLGNPIDTLNKIAAHGPKSIGFAEELAAGCGIEWKPPGAGPKSGMNGGGTETSAQAET